MAGSSSRKYCAIQGVRLDVEELDSDGVGGAYRETRVSP